MPKDRAKVKGHRRCFFALLKMERSLTLQAALEERDVKKPTTGEDVALAAYMQEDENIPLN